MVEYIERDKVLAEEEFFGEHATWDNPMADGCMAVRSDFIMNIPAADVAPIKYGKWRYFYTNLDNAYSRCSCCRLDVKEIVRYNYCPNCGAKMEAE